MAIQTPGTDPAIGELPHMLAGWQVPWLRRELGSSHPFIQTFESFLNTFGGALQGFVIKTKIGKL